MIHFLDLPNELQLEIFQYCLLLPYYRLHGDIRFILASVCRHWRLLTFNDKLLWKSITIDQYSVIPRYVFENLAQGSFVISQDTFMRTQIALNSGGNLPIDITVIAPDRNCRWPHRWFNWKHMPALSSILLIHVGRIASISVVGDDWPMHLGALKALFGQEMPLLHTFRDSIWGRVNISGFATFDAVEPRRQLIQALCPVLQYPYPEGSIAAVNAWGQKLYPSLRHVMISGAPYEWNKLPTLGLKTLTLEHQPLTTRPSYPLLRDMLAVCSTTLEELSLHEFVWDPILHSENDSTFQPVILPTLERLSIAYHNPNVVQTFLPSIRTPALKRLEVSNLRTLYQGFFDSPTDEMLEALMMYLPLHQVEKLVLDRIMFVDRLEMPNFYLLLREGTASTQTLPVTMRFLGSLTSLKHLQLWAADGYFLSLLNYPAQPSYVGGASATTIPPIRYSAYLPTLDTLWLDAYEDEMMVFLERRARWIHRNKPLYVFTSKHCTSQVVEDELQALKWELSREVKGRHRRLNNV